MVLARVGRKQLRFQLEFRAQREPGRAAERYLASLDEICELQSFLLAEADRENVTILNSEDMEETVIEAMELVTRHVMERFDPVMPDGIGEPDGRAEADGDDSSVK